MFTSRLYLKSVSSLILFLIVTAAFMSNTQATTFTVTKTADTNDGVCNDDCSLVRRSGKYINNYNSFNATIGTDTRKCKAVIQKLNN